MWKYIVLRVGNQEVPFIFPQMLAHSMVADCMCLYYAREAQVMSGNQLSIDSIAKLAGDIKVVAAGDINFGTFSCSGRSESLQIGSREEDFALIVSHYTHRVVEE